MQRISVIALSASLAALSAQSSYSEPFTYGATQNAASSGMTWNMGAVLPPETGLSVSGVIYRYTTTKDPDAPMTVTIQNENALGSGYIFRETDDWSGLPGNTINKMVPLSLTPIEYWGDGEIATTGQGTVSEPSVVYTYRIDECFDPQSNPSCPGYEPPFELIKVETQDIYNAMDDEAVKNATAETDVDPYEDGPEEERDPDDEEREDKRREERALAAVTNALALANAASQAAQIQAMNAVPQFGQYYASQIPGGAYPTSVALVDAHIPDNRRGLRNGLAQQVLHDQMVDMQYRR